MTQIHVITKKAQHTLKETIVVFHTTLIFIYQSSTVLRKNCLCPHFFTKYRSLSKKRTWFVTQIQIITKKSSTYTQGDYCVLSYDINIYNPEFHRFEKKLLMSVFFTRYRPVCKKRTWFVTQIQIITKKARHTLKGTIVVFHTTLIFISQSATVLGKNCLCQHFLQNIIPVSKKRTWFVTPIQIITEKKLDIHPRRLQWSFIRH